MTTKTITNTGKIKKFSRKVRNERVEAISLKILSRILLTSSLIQWEVSILV